MKHSPEYVAQWNKNLTEARAKGPVTPAELAAFVASLSETLSARQAAEYPGIEENAREAVVELGTKRARIVSQCPLKDERGRHYHASAYCFIDLANGDILKTAGYNAPAKGARGNIRVGNAGNWWNHALTPHGAAYRR